MPIHTCTPLTHLTQHPAVLPTQPGPFSSFLSVFSHFLDQPQSLLLRTNKLFLSLLVCGQRFSFLFSWAFRRGEKRERAASPQAKPSFSLSPSSRPSCAKWGRTMLGTLSPHCCIATKPHSAVLGHAWKAWKGGDGLLRWLWRVGSLFLFSFSFFSFFIWISFVIGLLFPCWEMEKEDGCPL